MRHSRKACQRQKLCPPVPVCAHLRLPSEAVGLSGASLQDVAHDVPAVSINGDVVHHLQRKLLIDIEWLCNLGGGHLMRS
jgi:hypothetical protein